jgi:hypothetical protein
MVEHELPGVQQGPKDIFEGLLFVLLLVDDAFQSSPFLRGRFARKAPNVKFIHDLFWFLLFFEPAGDDATFLNLLRRRSTIEQVQRLRERRFEFHFAGTNCFPSCPAKSTQKISRSRPIGNFDRSGSQRQSLKLFLAFGDLQQTIEH